MFLEELDPRFIWDGGNRLVIGLEFKSCLRVLYQLTRDKEKKEIILQVFRLQKELITST